MIFDAFGRDGLDVSAVGNSGSVMMVAGGIDEDDAVAFLLERLEACVAGIFELARWR